MQRLLFDSDVFCKLGIAGLLGAVLTLFGVTADDAGCLPALQHMLRRGKLRKTFGDASCDNLITVAEQMAAELAPPTALLDKLAGVDRIDVGEAQLFAVVAEHRAVLVTGDKRALMAVADVPDFPEMLAGRVATLEAILLALCSRLGDDVVRAAVLPVVPHDKTIQICFSAGNSDVRAALWSCFEAMKRDVAPLQLWQPQELT